VTGGIGGVRGLVGFKLGWTCSGWATPYCGDTLLPCMCWGLRLLMLPF